jgi:hypothetical protein
VIDEAEKYNEPGFACQEILLTLTGIVHIFIKIAVYMQALIRAINLETGMHLFDTRHKAFGHTIKSGSRTYISFKNEPSRFVSSLAPKAGTGSRGLPQWKESAAPSPRHI